MANRKNLQLFVFSVSSLRCFGPGGPPGNASYIQGSMLLGSLVQKRDVAGHCFHYHWACKKKIALLQFDPRLKTPGSEEQRRKK